MKANAFWSRPWVFILTAILLAVAVTATRLPFASRMLYAWDSANFALALSYYNVGFHQPHPPGYPLYVGIAALINPWIQDPNASLVYISIAASAGSVVALFLLASRMYGFWVGLASAAILSASVGFWGYGEVAYPYTCLAFLSTLVAWLCYLVWQGHRSLAVLCGLTLGIAAGIRQDLLAFLGPLWLVTVWQAGIPRLILSGVALCLVVASWLIPTVQLSGGWEAFQKASSAQSNYILFNYSVPYAGLEGLRRNTETLMLFLKQMFGLSGLVAIYALGRFLTFKSLVTDHRLPFLLLWFLPPVLVYTLVHIGDPGYVLSLLPPLCIVTAVGIRDVVRDLRASLLALSGRYQRLSGLSARTGVAGGALAAVIVLGLLAWNTHAFLLTPGPVRLTELRVIDSIIHNQVEYARSIQPGSAVILAKERYRQLKYYLPEYDLRLLYDEYSAGYIEARRDARIPEGVNTVLIMDFGRKPAHFPGAKGGETVLVSSPKRWVSLWRFDVEPGDTIRYGYDYFAVVK